MKKNKSRIQIGDIVWARTELGDHEELATVLQVAYPMARQSKDTDVVDDANEKLNNGVLVRYNVSMIKSTIAPNRLRAMTDDDNNALLPDGASVKVKGDNSRKTLADTGISKGCRRSRRVAAAVVSLALKAKSTAVGANLKQMKSIGGDEEDYGRASTRKVKELALVTSENSLKSDGDRMNVPGLSSPSVSVVECASEADDGDDDDDDDDNLTLKQVLKNNANNTSKKKKEAIHVPVNTKKRVNRKRKAQTNGDDVNTPSSAATPLSKSKSTSVTAFKAKKRQKSKANDHEIDKSIESPSSPYLKKKGRKIPAATTKKKSKANPKSKQKFNAVITTNDLTSSDESTNSSKGSPEYRVEYSTTSRAACKRCDIRINKHELRISHRPLFRGKPGFVIYKHLQCAVFSDSVTCAEDIGGYRTLIRMDKKRRSEKQKMDGNDDGINKHGDVNCNDDVKDESDFQKLERRVIESREELKKETEELQPDELVQKKFEGEIRESPVGLMANLLPFQVEGVSWIYHQERMMDDVRGGILADEMGMGKTLQAITTILDNRPRLQRSLPGAKHPPNCSDSEQNELSREETLWDKSLQDWKHEQAMNEVSTSILPKSTGAARKKSSGGGGRAGTLVICPVIALMQWKSEIEKFTVDGALSVTIYHGPDRVKENPREMLRMYDVVLTTYQVLQADFRKMLSPNHVKCPNCGKKFKIDKLRIHLKYFCGENAERTEAQARQRRNSDRYSARRQHNGSEEDNDTSGTLDTQKRKKAKLPLSKNANAKKNDNSVSEKRMEQKKLKLKGTVLYDSESDLSLPQQEENVQIQKVDATARHGGRPSREAANKARGRLSATASTREDVNDTDYSTDNGSSSDNDDSDEGFDGSRLRRQAKSSKPRYIGRMRKSIVVEDGDIGIEEESEAIKRARAKQANLLKQMRGKKGQKLKLNKKFKDLKEDKSKGKRLSQKDKEKKKLKKGAKHDDSDFSSSSDDGESSKNLEDLVDLDRLIEEATAGARMSVLHSLCWWRIVLDEAHYIKSRSSGTAQAAFSLIGIHRWCLSGTPLQNRVGEFYSLVRFLRLDPMAHYFCRSKGCDCKQIHYRMFNGKCKDCGHSSIQHYSHFNKFILNPIQRDGYAHDGRRAMFVLKNEVLDKCLLRRTKDTRADEMNLPPRIVTIKALRLHPIEEDFYNALYTQTRSSFNDYVDDGTLLNNYAHIFDLLMRMRQSVSHPYLVVFSKKGVGSASNAMNSSVSNGTTDCDICHEFPTDRITSTCCQAAFCRSCVLEYMETSAGIGAGMIGTPCPSCQAPFSIDLSQAPAQDVLYDNSSSVGNTKAQISRVGLPSLKELRNVATGSILRRIDLTQFATSTKIEALTQELIQMRKRSPGSKAIVFSQFVNMLDLIRWRLHSDPYLGDMGLNARALHGSMDVKSRSETLKDFSENPNTRVLLISLKAGGVALNLTVANYIYLMDPWWNPAAEMQAIDRTHRLGQYRPIRAVRFIAENTVEERILQLQEKKRLVFDGTVGRDAGSLKMLTVDDMKSLFV